MLLTMTVVLFLLGKEGFVIRREKCQQHQHLPFSSAVKCVSSNCSRLEILSSTCVRCFSTLEISFISSKLVCGALNLSFSVLASAVRSKKHKEASIVSSQF